MVDPVHYGYRQQAFFATELHEAGLRGVSDQKVAIGLGRILVHAAAGMSAGLIAPVEGVVFVPVIRRYPGHPQVGVAVADAALPAVIPEKGDRYPQRSACRAMSAMGAVEVEAVATEAAFDQAAVQRGFRRQARVHVYVAGLSVGEISTGMGWAEEEAQVRKRPHAHAVSGFQG